MLLRTLFVFLRLTLAPPFVTFSVNLLTLLTAASVVSPGMSLTLLNSEGWLPHNTDSQIPIG